MRFHLLLLLFLTGFSAFGQKETTQLIDASSIQNVLFASDEIFRIRLSTTSEETITIKSRADGEYYNDIGLITRVEAGTLYLSSQFREILQSGYDKLSAHKVFAMEVELRIPEGIVVEIISNLASVYGEGTYEKLVVQLKSGSCYLENFSGNALINTYEGDVEIQMRNAVVEAFSRHGSVKTPDTNFGTHKIDITSINGNISVQKTK